MEELDTVVDAIAEAQLVVAATGAGMSKESGIATFREAQEGLWERHNPEELATRQGFQENPARVWGWYNYRRGLIAQKAPHAGHRALAELEELVPQVIVVTQNIDGFHIEVGSSTVLEVHGNINRTKCFDRDHPVELDEPVSDCDGDLEPPKCPQCGSLVRPDVVWFGEMLPAGVFRKAEEASSACDVMLVVGTSGMVQPAANLPLVASASGATVVEVNVEPSQLTHYVDIFIEGPAGEILPQLVARLRARRSR